jgi:hypothetical protein
VQFYSGLRQRLERSDPIVVGGLETGEIQTQTRSTLATSACAGVDESISSSVAMRTLFMAFDAPVRNVPALYAKYYARMVRRNLLFHMPIVVSESEYFASPLGGGNLGREDSCAFSIFVRLDLASR